MARRSKQSVRIIAGQWRGRSIAFADSDDLRPSGDRVRETLFNWLAPEIAGANCLDLFSGSGILSFEALSRGAASAVAIDCAKPVVNAIRAAANTLQLQPSALQVLETQADHYLNQKSGQAFDIVFLDPPFKDKSLDTTLNQLASGGWMTKRGLVYWEQDRNDLPPELPENWQMHREKTAGSVRFGLIRC